MFEKLTTLAKSTIVRFAGQNYGKYQRLALIRSARLVVGRKVLCLFCLSSSLLAAVCDIGSIGILGLAITSLSGNIQELVNKLPDFIQEVFIEYIFSRGSPFAMFSYLVGRSHATLKWYYKNEK